VALERIAVLGAGSWGTAFAKVLLDAGRDVVVWARRQEVAAALREGGNPERLPGVALRGSLTATSDPARALDGAQAVVVAVPSQTLRANLRDWSSLLPAVPLMSLSKGIELGTGKRMSEVICEATGAPPERVAVLSGPTLAPEIAQEQPAGAVIACADHDTAVALRNACVTGYFRPYSHHDVVGCELGGACKNVIALACGMAAGLGFGANTTATLITRGLAEISRLGEELGAEPRTLSGLAGLGDLVATCSSPLSRNRSFGERLGGGATLAEAQEAAHGQVAEGVKSCSSIRELALRHGVDMPIADVVHRVCHDGASPRSTAVELLGRAHKHELA
jgi:glycerol-3-phosphate dehydrogenase (NAD(P)+)